MEDIFKLKKDQQAAFNALKRAFEKCEKSGLMLYNNYGTIGACDGSIVRDYNDLESDYPEIDYPNPNEIRMPCNEWADDAHFFHLR